MFPLEQSATRVPSPFDMAHFVFFPRFCLGGGEDFWKMSSYFSLRQICNLCTPPLTCAILRFFLDFASNPYPQLITSPVVKVHIFGQIFVRDF